MSEPLLRMPEGGYASTDGRFYFTRIGHRKQHGNTWRVIDAIRPQFVEWRTQTLADAKAWMLGRRRKVRA